MVKLTEGRGCLVRCGMSTQVSVTFSDESSFPGMRLLSADSVTKENRCSPYRGSLCPALRQKG